MGNHVRQLVPPPKPGDPPHNLQLPVSRFTGRTRELDEVRRLLGENRLVTLTGAGGCGKTRLALQVASTLLPHYPDGVWFATFATLRKPELIPEALAVVLGVRPEAERPLLELLKEHLGSRHTLLLLDNCEHLINASAALAEELLRAAPGLRILATSRERLNIDGEVCWPVPPFATPDPGQGTDTVQQVAAFDAVRLFVDRATAVQPGFALNEATAPHVTRIVQRLDGIPLAIELAAAQVQALSLEQIADRLSDRFRLLVNGRRAAPERQVTMRQAIDWSHDLLSEPERLLWYRLAILVGRFSLADAEEVCAGEGIPREEIWLLLTRLVEQSVLSAETRAGTVSYRLLETIQQYGEDRLRESGQERLWRDRHLDWCLTLAEAVTRTPSVQDQAMAFDRLERYLENLRAALAWAVASGDAERGVRLHASLHQFWLLRGYASEGLHWAGALLSLTESHSPFRGQVLQHMSILARNCGDYAQAEAFARQLLDHARRVGDVRQTGAALNQLAILARQRSEFDVVVQLLEECLQIARRHESPQRVGAVLGNLGMAAMDQGDYGAASGCFAEALQLFDRSGDHAAAAKSYISLGLVAYNLDDLPQARARFEQSLTIARELGARQIMAQALYNVGLVFWREGDWSQAARTFEAVHALSLALRDPNGSAFTRLALGKMAYEQGQLQSARRLLGDSLRVWARHPNDQGLLECLEYLGAVAVAGGQTELGVRLGAYADAGRKARNLCRSPFEERAFTRWVSSARELLAPEQFSRVWAAGLGMRADEAIALALAGCGEDRAPVPQESSRQFGALTGSQGEMPLSEREQQVVRLVVQGLSRGEMAKRLHISPFTVDRHLQLIYDKLHLPARSKAALAAWATRNGLAAD